ncbi:hypothetical protein EV201_2298 [Ancylomarina subtilis]|uniref:Fibronectin type-III domain-containing protein n=1 Tax=Ancylomarina subtilis TaxID=1639035 RepID=A0A4Q7V8V7_9BACT|nr:hypothetical protein [Ancylomarina subtilis]RZT93146.1 hypothetical protein EV201_2298 [Ancylomarina subtilis]
MKKIRNLCIAIIALVGLSSAAVAQNGETPYLGSTHSYTVDDHAGSTYAWSVTTDFQGTADASGVVTFSATTGNSINITWDSPAIGTTYFVHVVETNGEGCSNHKVLAVNPVNGFVLQLASVNDSDAVLTGADLQQCAPDASVTAYDPGTGNFTYAYGTNTFFYKITASGIGNNGWSPQFTLGTTDGAATYVATWGTTSAGTGNTVANLDGTTVNDIDVAGGNVSIWIKVVVTNAEGVTANPIVVTLLDGANTSEDEYGNDVTSVTGSAATQTVKARPNTSGITTI